MPYSKLLNIKKKLFGKKNIKCPTANFIDTTPREITLKQMVENKKLYYISILYIWNKKSGIDQNFMIQYNLLAETNPAIPFFTMNQNSIYSKVYNTYEGYIFYGNKPYIIVFKQGEVDRKFSEGKIINYLKKYIENL